MAHTLEGVPLLGRTRLLTPDDAEVLAHLVIVNRGYLAPWDPLRPEEWFTVAGQQAVIDTALEDHAAGRTLPLAILDDEARVAGRITLNGIQRGPLQSCSVGYWVSESHTGRGLAGAALREVKEVALGELGLHRIQGETLVHNAASRRVLERNGFVAFGLAPRYLRIAGRWQDMVLYQTLAA